MPWIVKCFCLRNAGIVFLQYMEFHGAPAFLAGVKFHTTYPFYDAVKRSLAFIKHACADFGRAPNIYLLER